jgi:hypothetical protein
MRHELTKIRMTERVGELIERFDDYVNLFNQKDLFTGPSVYFHNKTLDVLHQHTDVLDALHDDKFFDYLYATLTAWGLHRMGPGKTKLIEINQFKKSIQTQEEEIQSLQSLKIDEIPDDSINLITSRLWTLIDNIQVGIAETKIVSGSKALHHMLPELVPPIDREYTLMFFYNHKTLNRGDEVAFKEIYPYFQQISKKCKKEITRQMGRGMINTSKTKIIDNAIISYVSKEIKEK